MQREYDQFLCEKHNIEGMETVKDETVLALFDEICELMNKMRIHKYWSTKGMAERKVLLEEYVDTWHILLSVGNSIQTPTTHEGAYSLPDYTNTFRQLLFIANDIFTPVGWHLFVNMWKGLGQKMGFTAEEVEKAFVRKLKKNYRRQERGY